MEIYTANAMFKSLAGKEQDRKAGCGSIFFPMVKPESIYRLKRNKTETASRIEGKYRENDGSRNRDSRRWGPTWERDSSTSSEPRGHRLGAAQGGMDPWLGPLPSCVAFTQPGPSWQRVEPDLEVGE